MSNTHERSNRSNEENLNIVVGNVRLLSASNQDFTKSMLGQLDARGTLSEKQWYWMDVFANRIINEARVFGRKTGKCVFCRRKLTHPLSTEVGYGPICAERNHLPYGENNARN